MVLQSGISVVLVVVLILIIIFVIKCCLNARQRPKDTRSRARRPAYGNSYQSLSENFTRAGTTGPPTTGVILTRADVTGLTEIDGIVLMPEPNSASPVVVPPYPVEPRHPTPQAAPPAPGFAALNPPYPTQPSHPVPGTTPYPPAPVPTPYLPVAGITPYPPSGPPIGGTAPYPEYSPDPPSYSEAVAQPSISKDGYSKQAPYNPNY